MARPRSPLRFDPVSALLAALLVVLLGVLVVTRHSSDQIHEVIDEAREALLLDQMDVSLQAAAVDLDLWLSSPELEGAPLDRPAIARALATLRAGAEEMAESIKQDDQILADLLLTNVGRYEAALQGLHRAASGSDLSELYRTEVQPIERTLRSALTDVRHEELEHLEEAATAAEADGATLAWMIPLLLAIAMLLVLLLRRVQARARRTEDAERLNAAKTAFIAGVSHELRTPLTTVLGLSHEMQESVASFTPAELEEFAALIAGESARVADIVDDLIVAARHESGSLVVGRVPVDVTRQIDAVVARYPDVVVRPTGTPAVAAADAARVRQIVRNLIATATHRGGTDVDVSANRRGDLIHVVVSNGGAPIPSDQQAVMFDPFGRFEDSPGGAGSVGLGLAISRQLARHMGGDLDYRYVDGRSVYDVTLPAHDGEPVPA